MTTDAKDLDVTEAPIVGAPTMRVQKQITICQCGSHFKCEHEWGGWRAFEDGNGGEQVCKKCGLGAMAHSLREGF